MSPPRSWKITIAPAALGLFVDELGGDDALRLQTEAVAVEGERAFEIVDSEGDDIETRLHRLASSFALLGAVREVELEHSLIERNRSVLGTSRSRRRHVVAEDVRPEAVSSR